MWAEILIVVILLFNSLQWRNLNTTSILLLHQFSHMPKIDAVSRFHCIDFHFPFKNKPPNFSGLHSRVLHRCIPPCYSSCICKSFSPHSVICLFRCLYSVFSRSEKNREKWFFSTFLGRILLKPIQVLKTSRKNSFFLDRKYFCYVSEYIILLKVQK